MNEMQLSPILHNIAPLATGLTFSKCTIGTDTIATISKLAAWNYIEEIIFEDCYLCANKQKSLRLIYEMSNSVSLKHLILSRNDYCGNPFPLLLPKLEIISLHFEPINSKFDEGLQIFNSFFQNNKSIQSISLKGIFEAESNLRRFLDTFVESSSLENVTLQLDQNLTKRGLKMIEDAKDNAFLTIQMKE